MQWGASESTHTVAALGRPIPGLGTALLNGFDWLTVKAQQSELTYRVSSMGCLADMKQTIE